MLRADAVLPSRLTFQTLFLRLSTSPKTLHTLAKFFLWFFNAVRKKENWFNVQKVGEIDHLCGAVPMCAGMLMAVLFAADRYRRGPITSFFLFTTYFSFTVLTTISFDLTLKTLKNLCYLCLMH